MEVTENAGHDIGLLSNLGFHCSKAVVRFKENKGNGIEAPARAVLRKLYVRRSMIRRNYKKGILVPGHSRHFFKKLPEGVIRVLDTSVDRKRAAPEGLIILFRNLERMMR